MTKFHTKNGICRCVLPDRLFTSGKLYTYDQYSNKDYSYYRICEVGSVQSIQNFFEKGFERRFIDIQTEREQKLKDILKYKLC